MRGRGYNPRVLFLHRRRSGAAVRVRRIRKLRLLAVLWVFGLLGVAMFSFGLVVSIRSQLPELDPAAHRDQQNGVVYARDGKSVLLVLRGSESRTIVKDEDISYWIKYAIVAIEDRRFWEHRGVDLRGILRAAWQDVTKGHVVEGGSTITQQFVKQAFGSSQKTIARKLREAAFAWQLEQKWSKTDILDAYLNTIFFGNQAYGIEQACRIYFGHSAKHMTLAEAALLAGIPQDPNLYDPIAHPKHSKARRTAVLRAMLAQGLIDRGQFRKAMKVPLPRAQDIQHPAVLGKAPYFANYVREQLLATYRRDTVYGGGLKVETTIDLNLQRLARDAVQKWLPSAEGPQAALVALDTHTGAVLAMVGGRNYHESQFNLATQRNRQVGSSFKPFVLTTALREGIAPQTTFESGPVTINADGRLWQVENYEGESLGLTDLSNAMVHSDNSVFAQLTALVGPKNVARTAKLLGIGGLKGYFSIGLGGEAVSPIEMARAYAAFANGGYRIDGSLTGNRPRAIASVERNGAVHQNRVVGRHVLSEADAATVDEILRGVVRSGTGRAAAVPGWEIAGKTGTTEDYGDAWFVGYTPQLVVAVWVGYPDRLVPMQTDFHGSPVVGGTYPALIFKAFMQKALPYLKVQPEPFPATQSQYVGTQSVVQRDGKLQRDNGHCHGARTVAFYGGTALPTADCKPNEVAVPSVVGQSIAEARARLAAQPLTPTVVYKPAAPRQKLGVVLGQFPKDGTLSSYDKVTLVLAKPLHGVVPKVVGLPLAKAEQRLERRHLETVVTGGDAGRIVSQKPAAGVAAAPGMTVTLSVADG
jgi:penicillin-binding protein 1A